MYSAPYCLFAVLIYGAKSYIMDIRKLARFLEETQYLPEEIAFRSDWLGWRLAYCDALLNMHGSQREVVGNIARYAAEHENHKLVFRTSGNIFCDYVYLFVNDGEEPELPFYMLGRNEIFNYYDQFMERLDVSDDAVVFRTDDRVYRFEDYDYLIEEYGDETCSVFLEEEMWEYIYSGRFDPLPLTEKTDSWGRRILRVHSEVPKI